MSKYFGRDVDEEEALSEDEYEYDKDGNIVCYAIRPNKTQIKKEFALLFATGEQMAKLSMANLESLALPIKIQEAVLQISNMPLNNARKRLLKYIAGQLYKIDYAPILEQLATLQNKNAHATREHHIVEKWRDRLLIDNSALTDLLDEYPHADRQQLRQLVRQAQKEIAENKPPKSSRLLYRYLKDLFESELPDEMPMMEMDNEFELDDDEYFDDFEDDDEFDEED